MASLCKLLFSSRILSTRTFRITAALNDNLCKVNSISEQQYRHYRGSNRFKKMDAKRKQEKLEKQLEEKYGIKSKSEFNFRKWFLRNYFKELNAFQHRLGLMFNNMDVLISAFAHTSFSEEMEKLSSDKKIRQTDDTSNLEDDEDHYRMKVFEKLSAIPFAKLSVMGYGVLERTLREKILSKYPNITASLCNQLLKHVSYRERLNELASSLAISDLILASKDIEKGCFKGRQFHHDYINADVFCSLVGAVYLDIGGDSAVEFVNDFVSPLMDYEDLSSHVNLVAPHMILKDILSMHGISGEVKARTIAETGVDTHFPVFYVGVYCNGIKMSEGSSYSAATARTDAFTNAVFQCIENDVSFSVLKKIKN